MTLSERAQDVRARTHSPTAPTGRRSTSGNSPGRPSLRVISGDTHIRAEGKPTTAGHAPSEHLTDVTEAIITHPIAAMHPPTVVEAARRIWLSPDEVRHGLAGQLGAAAAGLVQVIGLALCWATARVFFATKIQAALFLLVLIATLAAFAVASHT